MIQIIIKGRFPNIAYLRKHWGGSVHSASSSHTIILLPVIVEYPLAHSTRRQLLNVVLLNSVAVTVTERGSSGCPQSLSVKHRGQCFTQIRYIRSHFRH